MGPRFDILCELSSCISSFARPFGAPVALLDTLPVQQWRAQPDLIRRFPQKSSAPREHLLPGCLRACKSGYGGSMLGGADVIVFDCDGVLIDSEWAMVTLWVERLNELGATFSPDAYAA